MPKTNPDDKPTLLQKLVFYCTPYVCDTEEEKIMQAEEESTD